MSSHIPQYSSEPITRKIQKLFFLNILLLIFPFNMFDYNNSYIMSVEQIKLVDNLKVSFSIYIENVGEKLDLTSYQCVFRINENFDKSNVSFTYIKGSSELKTKPDLIVGIENSDSAYELVFVSLPGYDEIISKTLVGTFILEGIERKDVKPSIISWDFEGSIKTIISGKDFSNITDPENHKSILSSDQNLVATNDDKLKVKFSVRQNFPNPFNSFTRFRFTLPQKSEVTITVYNILGEKISNNYSREFIEGYHEVDINSTGYPSGIYFYKIQAGKFLAIKKMVLLK